MPALNRWRAATGLLLAAALALLPAMAGAAAPAQLTEAEFTAAGANAPTAVTLPDTWAQRGLTTHGAGRYRLHFTLAQVPAQPWGLSFTRISSSRRVWLNGTLIEDESPAGRQSPQPDVIDLPTQLLRAGDNEVEIDVAYRVRGGLSTAELGPGALLQAEAERAAVWNRELPRSLNMGMAMVAVLMLLIRWRRPGETTIALFGALALLGSVRNYTYFASATLLPPGGSDWLFFCTQIWTAALFVAFARSLGEQHARPWIDRLLLASAIALPLVAALLTPLNLLPALRTFTYPLLLIFAAVAVRLLWRSLRHIGGRANHTLVASFGAVVFAGAHDYAFQQGHLSMTGTFWMPYVMPFALGLYALVLLDRFVGAIGEVEALRDQLEERVAQRTVALEAAVAAKARFLAAASHDLRQPAVAIGLMIGLVREHALTPDVRHMIERAHQAVGALESLLQGLLDLSRLESGVVRPQLAALPLQSVFDAIQSHEADAAAAKGLRLRFRAQGLAVRCDPQLLDQLLRNLVGNALRYTERGGVLVVARPRGADRVRVQVWDTGIGIAPQHQAEVFEEFVQIDNPARDSARGLGLGLALVKRCAALLETRVELRSRPGRGSCFEFTLPRVERRQAQRALRPMLPAPLAGRRLVVVDDDASVRGAIAARLAAWGAQVVALDGLPAVRDWLVQVHEQPDMLLTDQQLPEGSGLQVVDAVRAVHGPVPALLITGNTAPTEIARLVASGVPVLHKPFRAEALLTSVQKAMADRADAP
jgi:signal transduction histidine kinase/CheY-like chemotaxis protein